ncbi:HD-GYP domain-containing protein [Cohnella abietis]|uniref:HD-GYP domain-containing protein n=1 Tax=Cohnella abietis TaxID=2507935 RepID=A0A3T1DC22_9BACL|nr:HD domain-containing phosphohydrolase [Cohnella abietis]BBI35508.1 hypothetical protein KCTCHS21_49070 [Cohnella abietis]
MKDEWYLELLLQLLKKDATTYEHSLRVGKLCEIMAGHLNLDEKEAKHLIHGGYLHDIGKIHIPEDILKKDSTLTKEEWKMMQTHALLGSEMMCKYVSIDQEILEVIQFHHERWNGKGYPCGLSQNEIPKLARICGILDSFDSMVSIRPYCQSKTFAEAKEELVLCSGTQFDKEYVDIFIRWSASFEEVYLPQKIHK